MSDETTILYRPVGQTELNLIRESGFRAFPPRLFWKPIFYPVLNEEYAVLDCILSRAKGART
jgi:hypothetical protein